VFPEEGLRRDLFGRLSDRFRSGFAGGGLFSGPGFSGGASAVTLRGAGGGLGFLGAALLLGHLGGAGVHALLALRRHLAGGLGAFELLVEALDLAGRIDDALLTGVEGVADVAKVDAEALTGRAGFDHVATGTGDRGLHVIGVKSGLH